MCPTTKRLSSHPAVREKFIHHHQLIAKVETAAWAPPEIFFFFLLLTEPRSLQMLDKCSLGSLNLESDGIFLIQHSLLNI